MGRCALSADLLLAPAGPKYIESLLKKLFEFGAGATLKQHVPVGTCDLGFDQFAHYGFTIDIEENSLVA